MAKAIAAIHHYFVGLFLLLFAMPSVYAATGMDWLSLQQDPYGAYHSVSDIANSDQATSEALSAINLLSISPGQSNPDTALSYLNTVSNANTELLSRQIKALHDVGADVTVLTNTLASYQNEDGGFGEKMGYNSRVLDTAFALAALNLTMAPSEQLILRTINYLKLAQSANGSWPENSSVSSAYTTALVMKALFPHRKDLSDVRAVLSSAQSYLLSQMGADSLWGESFESAQVLISMAPQLSPDVTPLSNSVNSLRARQIANGSWDSDVFTTALVLQAFYLFENPPVNPDLVTLSGKVIDSQTGLSLAGVSVVLSGAASQTYTTTNTGLFEFVNYPPGDYSITVEMAGYLPMTSTATVPAGRSIDFGTLSMTQVQQTAGQNATTGTLIGKITDLASGIPLAGVSIMVNGAEVAVTDASGNYQVTNMPLGTLSLSTYLAGYESVSGSVDIIAGGMSWFSPALGVKNVLSSTLEGVVIDANTGAAVAGATIQVSGSTQASAVTDASGAYSLANIAAGNLNISVQASGYDPASTSSLITGNQIVRYSPALYPLNTTPTVNDPYATISGVVTDAMTGTPIAGASLILNGVQVASTDANGAYAIANISPGSVELSVQMAGYSTVATSATVSAGDNVIFSPSMEQSLLTGSLQGTVIDAATGQPLAGVTIDISGSSVLSATTDATGHYVISDIAPGQIAITASLGGYDPVQASSMAYAGGVINFSPAMYALATTPANANSASVRGVVMDSGTNQPLSGVSISAQFGVDTYNFVTASDGTFLLEGITEFSGNMTFTLAGYTDVAMGVMLEPLQVLDMGQVRMRKADVVEILPDLSVSRFSTSGMITDQQTLAVSGMIDADILNSGTVVARAGVTVSAFQDANGNGQLDVGVDTVLGEAVTFGDIQIDTYQTIKIPVTGAVSFRDAPIYVWVDSLQSEVELDETNNIEVSCNDCISEPTPVGAFQPKLKWWWRGSNYYPKWKNVMSTPAVAQINDDNGDGQINEEDIPDIIFPTFPEFYAWYGVLRAISGADGRELWAKYGTSCVTAPAVGDIDGDGLVEIVISSGYQRDLHVFEHDGTLKWTVKRPKENFATPSLADLNHDGKVEILYNDTVYDGDGNVLWTHIVDHSAIAVDLDMQGDMEVLAGGAAYDAYGQLLWQQSAYGNSIIGNFDSDPNPEIVFRSSSNGSITLSLLEHTGELIWGPVAVPGGGGGMPTVADLDGDGEPEIGITGSTYYTVFETDGSIKWQRAGPRDKSGGEGSSAFDFDGDGKAEIMFGDESRFWILDGTTGGLLFVTPNSSGTGSEVPVVADIDNDGHAELIVTSNFYAWGSQNGIRVYENANDDWMPTRSIWNQYNYHIDNVNDDGTIPRYENPGWLSHNSFRSNPNLERAAQASSDLTVSRLIITDQGAGQPLSLTVRVGNGGAVASPASEVAFYDGDPAAGGVLLGTVAVPAIEVGAYLDMTLSGVAAISAISDIHALVDPNGLVNECNETNNQTWVTPGTQAQLAAITALTDQSSYTSNMPVFLTAQVANSGALAGNFTVQMQVEDSSGNVMTSFAPVATGTLASSGQFTANELWNSGGYLAGTYQLRATLLDGNGNMIGKAVFPFAIVHSTAGDSPIASSVTTDRQTYQAWDVIAVTGRVQNISGNTIQPASVVNIELLAPDASQLQLNSNQLNNMQPGAVSDISVSFQLVDVVAGAYHIKLSVKDAGTLAVIGTATTTVQVVRNSAQAVTGTTSVSTQQVHRRDPTTCSDSITNISATNLTGVSVSRQLVNLDSGLVVSELVSQVDIYANATTTLPVRNIDTIPLNKGSYACLLSATVNGSTSNISFAGFDVVNTVPVANAGVDVYAYVGDVVTLDSSASSDADGDPLSYLWGLTVPVGSASALNDPYAAMPTLAIDAKGTYQASLTVSDGIESSAADNMQITVLNRAPIASAGLDVYGTLNTPALVDGIASYDLDGDPLSYQWSVSASPVGSMPMLLTPAASNPGFTGNMKGTYSLQLVVNDGTISSAPAFVNVVIPNTPPVANAGIDVYGMLNMAALIDGIASSDVDGDPLTYSWSIVASPAGSQTLLASPTASNPGFSGDKKGSYTLQLIVNDGTADSVPVFVNVIIPNTPPVADAGLAQTVYRGDTVQLNASASSDVNNDPLSYSWSLTTPAGSTAVLSSATAVAPMFVADVDGDYVAELIVSDGEDVSSLASVTITVLPPPIELDNRLSQGSAARLLAWLPDSDREQSDGEHDDDAESEYQAAAVQNSADRLYFESMLDRMGWAYVIVNDEESFLRELHSGGYSVYALLGNGFGRMDEQIAQELRAAQYRGAGILFASADDVNALEQTMGVEADDGRSAISITLDTSELSDGGMVSFAEAIEALRTKAEDATSLGTLQLDSLNRGKDRGKDDHHDSGSAVALSSYGAGSGVFIGFDLLQQARIAGGDITLFGNLLERSLQAVRPDVIDTPGAWVPVELRIDNVGTIATEGLVTVTLPQGVQTDDPLEYAFAINVGESFAQTLWLQLPAQAGAYEVTADIKAGIDANLELYESVSTMLNVAVESGMAELTAMSGSADKHVRKQLDRAAKAWGKADMADTLKYLLKAEAELINEDNYSESLMQALAWAIREVELLMPAETGKEDEDKGDDENEGDRHGDE